MKAKTNVALDLETLARMRELVKSGSFRNKSHVMEFSIKKLIEDRKSE